MSTRLFIKENSNGAKSKVGCCYLYVGRTVGRDSIVAKRCSTFFWKWVARELFPQIFIPFLAHLALPWGSDVPNNRRHARVHEIGEQNTRHRRQTGFSEFWGHWTPTGGLVEMYTFLALYVKLCKCFVCIGMIMANRVLRLHQMPCNTDHNVRQLRPRRWSNGDRGWKSQ